MRAPARRRPATGYATQRVPLMVLVCAVGAALFPHRAPALSGLPCGIPLTRHLDAGASNAFQVTLASAATAVIEVANTAGNIGLIKLRVADQGVETCSGALRLNGPGTFTVTVSDCIGNDSGDYTIVENVVSPGVDNCSLPLP